MMFTRLTEKNFRQEVLESPQPVLVEFFTNWSGSCHIIEPILKEVVAKFRTRVKFYAIDVDEQEELAKAYGVQNIPTILFFKDGQVVDHIIGAESRIVIKSKLDTLLNKGG